jgi:signal transduction histidine kinase
VSARALAAAVLRLRLALSLVAGAAAFVAATPHVLGTGVSSGVVIGGDVAPWLAILVGWHALGIRATRSSERLWALPSDLFRFAIVIGGALVVLARVGLLGASQVGARPAAIVATTAEDVIYELGIVALGALAAFALARTVLRPGLRFQPSPIAARDVSLRTRFVLVAGGASFATAGVLLDVLVDFERTPDATLVGYVLVAAALVSFATVIGWLLGNDAARGVSALTHRLRDVAPADLAADAPALLAADEIAELAVAAMELERRIRRDAIRDAAATERERIARELHDGVAKSVSILALEAATVADRAPSDARAGLDRIARLARLLSEELRAIVTDVRSRDDPRPFADALRGLVERHANADLSIEGDVERIGTLARFETLRIVDEALANAVRHADAQSVHARVLVAADRVDVEVEDDGVGVPAVEWEALSRAGRYGLVGIRERVALLRGNVSLGRGRLGGTLLRVQFPLLPT